MESAVECTRCIAEKWRVARRYVFVALRFALRCVALPWDTHRDATFAQVLGEEGEGGGSATELGQHLASGPKEFCPTKFLARA